MNVVEGSRVRRSIVSWSAVALWAAAIFIGSSQPGSNIPGGYSVYGHLGEYAVMGALLAWALLASRPWLVGDRPWRAALLATFAASMYGVTDEFHQSFVPGRTPDPADWALDTVGALLGAFAITAAVAWWRSRRERAAQSH